MFDAVLTGDHWFHAERAALKRTNVLAKLRLLVRRLLGAASEHYHQGHSIIKRATLSSYVRPDSYFFRENC